MAKNKDQRRREARGLGPNGVSVTVPQTTAAPAVAQVPKIVPTTQTEVAPSAPITQLIVPANALVKIEFETNVTDRDGQTTIVTQGLGVPFPAKNLAASSQRFCDAVQDLPRSTDENGIITFTLTMSHEHVTIAAVGKYMRYLAKEVTWNYKGPQRIPIRPVWTIEDHAQLYQVTQYLRLKSPFSTSHIYAALRDYLSTSLNSTIEPETIVAIWRSTTASPTDHRLRSMAVAAAVSWVEASETWVDRNEEWKGFDDYEETEAMQFVLSREPELMEAYSRRRCERTAYLARKERRQRRAEGMAGVACRA